MNQQSAQGLASLGRGPDSMLVHMAPGEVKSLQQLAMAHGGSLTINPETGLPEAGFLSSILPPPWLPAKAGMDNNMKAETKAVITNFIKIPSSREGEKKGQSGASG